MKTKEKNQDNHNKEYSHNQQDSTTLINISFKKAIEVYLANIPSWKKKVNMVKIILTAEGEEATVTEQI